MALYVEQIATSRYAPHGSDQVYLYANELEGGQHLTLGQLVIAVSMRSAAEYEGCDVFPLVLQVAENHVYLVWNIPVVERPSPTSLTASTGRATNLAYASRPAYQVACIGVFRKMHLQPVVILIADALSYALREN